MGRPKGSKNKKTLEREKLLEQSENIEEIFLQDAEQEEDPTELVREQYQEQQHENQCYE